MTDKKAKTDKVQEHYHIFNNIKTPSNTPAIYLTNRAFQYGDGFFETMMVYKGQLLHENAHWERIEQGCSILGFKIQTLPDLATLHSALSSIHPEQATDYYRFKLLIWRGEGGLYTPSSRAASWALYCTGKHIANNKQNISAAICINSTNVNTSFSELKTLSALPYVMAGKEKESRQVDELLILDAFGNISESVSATIWWSKNNILYTPSLETGCVNGTMRKEILRFCQKNQIATQFVKTTPEVLNTADIVFCTNVAGLRIINQLEQQQLPEEHPIIPLLEPLFLGEDHN